MFVSGGVPGQKNLKVWRSFLLCSELLSVLSSRFQLSPSRGGHRQWRRESRYPRTPRAFSRNHATAKIKKTISWPNLSRVAAMKWTHFFCTCFSPAVEQMPGDEGSAWPKARCLHSNLNPPCSPCVNAWNCLRRPPTPTPAVFYPDRFMTIGHKQSPQMLMLMCYVMVDILLFYILEFGNTKCLLSWYELMSFYKLRGCTFIKLLQVT